MRIAIIALALLAAFPARAADDCGGLSGAAYEGADAEVRRLVQAGVSASCQFSDGWTPLMHAIVAGRLSTVKLLLSLGADPGAKRATGFDTKQMALAAYVTAMGQEAEDIQLEIAVLIDPELDD